MRDVAQAVRVGQAIFNWLELNGRRVLTCNRFGQLTKENIAALQERLNALTKDTEAAEKKFEASVQAALPLIDVDL